METRFKNFLVAILLHAILDESVARLPDPVYIQPINLTGVAGQTCAANEDREAAIDILRSTIRGELQSTVVPFFTHPCGRGNWQRVFTLNTTDPTQKCPGSWSLDTRQTRACAGQAQQCVSAYSNVPTGARSYTEVCGRVLGDAIGSPDAFFRIITGGDTLEGNYLDGVSVTYGATGSRTHVWTFGTGHTGRCPCDSNNHVQAPFPISAVGEDYFCDIDDGSGYLWGGVGCTNVGSCCNFHDPPYFKVRLTAPTTERMELRICNDQISGDESVLVIFADLYVQ